MYGAAMPHDPPVNEIKAELFRALAHPVRIRALELLVEHPCTVSELQAEMGIDAPACHSSSRCSVAPIWSAPSAPGPP